MPQAMGKFAHISKCHPEQPSSPNPPAQSHATVIPVTNPRWRRIPMTADLCCVEYWPLHGHAAATLVHVRTIIGPIVENV